MLFLPRSTFGQSDGSVPLTQPRQDGEVRDPPMAAVVPGQVRARASFTPMEVAQWGMKPEANKDIQYAEVSDFLALLGP